MSFMVDCPNYAIDTHIYQAWSWEGKYSTGNTLLSRSSTTGRDNYSSCGGSGGGIYNL